MDKLTAKGYSPASPQGPDQCCTSIDKMYSDRYNKGYNAGYSAGYSDGESSAGGGDSGSSLSVNSKSMSIRETIDIDISGYSTVFILYDGSDYHVPGIFYSGKLYGLGNYEEKSYGFSNATILEFSSSKIKFKVPGGWGNGTLYWWCQ